MNRSCVQWRGSYIDDSEWRHIDKDVEDRICDIRVGERAYERCKKKDWSGKFSIHQHATASSVSAAYQPRAIDTQHACLTTHAAIRVAYT